MKILWFSLSPCGSIRRLKHERIIQGWMISLEDELKKVPNINLNVAYFSDIIEDPFYYDGVQYYPIYDLYRKSKFGHVLERLKSFDYLDKKILPQMIDIVKKCKPDLIHIHGTEERFGLISDYIKDIPVVYSIQGMISPYKEKYFSGIPLKYAKKYEPLGDKIKLVSVFRTFKSFCFRSKRELRFLKNANFIIGRTYWDKYITLGLNPQRQYYVVNEVLRPPFYQKRWKMTKPSTNKIIIVSTISGGIYKGFETVLKAADILKSFTDIEFEWLVAGYESQSKWVKISEYYTRLKHQNLNVTLLGRLDAEKLSDLLCSSDIYSHVSHIENSPNSVCEAMILGMPIIASYAGGTASLLDSEKEGILVQDGDPYILAGEIVRLAKDFDFAASLGKKARMRALSRHNKDNIINELITTYKSILDYTQKSKR